jgi:hypothetical protein
MARKRASKKTKRVISREVIIPELKDADFKSDSELLYACQNVVKHLDKDIPIIKTFITQEELRTAVRKISTDPATGAQLVKDFSTLENQDPTLRCFLSFWLLSLYQSHPDYKKNSKYKAPCWCVILEYMKTKEILPKEGTYEDDLSTYKEQKMWTRDKMPELFETLKKTLVNADNTVILPPWSWVDVNYDTRVKKHLLMLTDKGSAAPVVKKKVGSEKAALGKVEKGQNPKMNFNFSNPERQKHLQHCTSFVWSGTSNRYS